MNCTLQIILLIFIFINNKAISELCHLQSKIVSTTKLQLYEANLYFYIPLAVFDLHENSVIIYNDAGEIVDCLNHEDFIHRNNLKEADNIFFFSIKHITKDVYILSLLSFENQELSYGKAARWVFIDSMFNIRKELPMISIADTVESPIFNPDGNLNLHDIIVDESLNFAIIIIKQKTHVRDVKSLFPNSLISEFELAYDGLCAIDLKTGKERAVLPGNGIFVDVDQWWEYINNLEASREFFFDILYSETSEKDVFDATYINSLIIVDGSHFSPRYSKDKLILLNAKLQDTAYLLKWDINENTEAEVIWKLPSYRAPRIIKEDWAHRWEFVNDPLYGPSYAHDFNIYNLPKGHVLVHDNGSQHRVSSNEMLQEYACPMSRSVEYKIEMDRDGRIGYHKITLVFSYPKVIDYPENIYFENEPEYIVSQCKEFWNEYNYQEFIGSVRKLEDGDYVMTYYPHELMASELLTPLSTRLLRVNSKGNIVNAWYSLHDIDSPTSINDFTQSYRINPISLNYFRTKMYSNNNDSIEI